MIKEFKIDLPEQFHKSAIELIHMGFEVTSYIQDSEGEQVKDSNGFDLSITKIFNMVESVNILSYIMGLSNQEDVQYIHEITYTAIV